MKQPQAQKTILWWGRFDADYSRNRILRGLLRNCGHQIVDFQPHSSLTGTIESILAGLPPVDALWVPTFRQSDLRSARRFADRRSIPLIFDPLISAWDKAVFERQKFSADSRRGRRLLVWERSLFAAADLVLADTAPHRCFFVETLGAQPEKTFVVPVGAEEALFPAQPLHEPHQPPELLFFGSFIGLQGPEVIVDAAARLPEARWTLLGDGPLGPSCRHQAGTLSQVRFEPWLPYDRLARRIGEADILLGIFGASPKAGRVIPNKVYQALACGRPLITRCSNAYPEELAGDPESGICFVPPADGSALAAAAAALLAERHKLAKRGLLARRSYERFFAGGSVKQALLTALAAIDL
ncbi:glycosyltransferase [Desulfofustis glycolicus]|uniref:Glycosyltransferase involved in cell wall bisynthesis n=1 Tax=Desulfofustis glycolicus DSM 9705 TaxID=1121409 RepID=A0A1M5SY06_9BACT|nr:glycosyltransferase [Desulfofustis glycolicus]SHH43230.1 Glycosyltransferase involved in cell wall bisynthesis [Desulfofustis glycolicus DSM 9705]